MPEKIAIVTDSAADLTPEVAQKHNIYVVPLTIRFDESEYLDGVELSNDEFWQKMGQSSNLPSTAAPSPGQFTATFNQARQDGATSVVCLNLSSKLSATYQAAVAGARDVAPGLEVQVMDTRSCALAQGSLCLEAARVSRSGATSTDEVLKAVDALRERSHLYAALDTLENLRKGGRIGAASAFFGSLLAFKPIVTLRDGEVQAESKQRTRSRALQYVAKLATEKAPIDHVVVAHSNAPDLDQFIDLLTPVAARDSIEVSKIGPVVGTHTGPGLIAVSFAST